MKNPIFLWEVRQDCRASEFADENKLSDINLIEDCNSVVLNDILYGLSIMIGIKLLPRRSQQLQQQHPFVIRSLHFFLICCEACRIGMSSIKVKSFQLQALFIRLTWHRQDSSRDECLLAFRGDKNEILKQGCFVGDHLVIALFD